MRVEHYERSNRAPVASGAMVWPAVVVISAVVVAAASLFQIVPSIRLIAAFWFLLVCPGMAFVPLLPIHDRLIQFGVAVALSLGLDGVVSEAMLSTGAWSDRGELAVLIGVCLVGTALQLRQLVRKTAMARAVELSRR